MISGLFTNYSFILKLSLNWAKNTHVQKIYHDSGATAWTMILVIAKKHAWDNESKESEVEVQETEQTFI